MVEYNPDEIFKPNNGELDSNHTVIYEGAIDDDNLNKQIRK
jgi:hypothetical protein